MGLAVRSKQRTKSELIPVPTGGINALDSLMSMPSEDCIHLINLIPGQYGQKVRKGYELNCSSDFGVSTEIRTVIPYQGSLDDGSKDKLFVATDVGIYEVSGGTATSKKVFASSSGDAGWCSFTSYTTIGDKFIILCDGENGYYTYTESTNTWDKITYGAGAHQTEEDPSILSDTPDPTKFVFCMVWRNRVWFVERNTGKAWYLAVGFVSGAYLRPFYFGNKFQVGGYLSSLHNYTFDSGVGPDDYLIAISSAGDLLAYAGTDPTDVPASFNLVGSWKIGHLPKGRRYAAESGGDLYILCSFGIVSVAQTLKGIDPGVIPAYITGKATPLVRADFASASTLRGWELLNHPTEGTLILVVPTNTLGFYTQYIMNIATRAWARWVGLPMYCTGIWKGTLYFGKKGTSLYTYSSTQDLGQPISWFFLSSFQPGEQQGHFKIGQFIRPQFIANSTPLYETELRYDFDIDDAIDVTGLTTPIPVPPTTVWGSAVWGSAYWTQIVLAPVDSLQGASGIGIFMAIALTGKSSYETTLIGFTLMYEEGGVL